VHEHPRARAQRWDQRAEDLDNVGVGPVVEDLAEGVDCGIYWLRGEEVVLHEFDAGRHGGGKGRAVDALDGAGQLLHDEVKVRIGTCKSNAELAVGASEVDDGGRAEAGPGEIGREVGVRHERRSIEDSHGAREALGLCRLLAKCLEERLTAVGERPALEGWSIDVSTESMSKRSELLYLPFELVLAP
jgi:hypothetical protein